jgi:hypothetical protein
MNARNLEPKMLELLNNSNLKKKAGQLADPLKKENFGEEIYNSIIRK